MRAACMVTKPVLDELKYGQAMSQLREDSGISGPEMAKMIGVTFDDLCKFESGMLHLPIGKQLRYVEICHPNQPPP